MTENQAGQIILLLGDIVAQLEHMSESLVGTSSERMSPKPKPVADAVVARHEASLRGGRFG